jgi:hypothetical protein
MKVQQRLGTKNRFDLPFRVRTGHPGSTEEKRQLNQFKRKKWKKGKIILPIRN